MHIEKTHPTNFGRLYKGYTVNEIIEKGDKQLKSEMNKVSRAIRKENLHKTKNVDILLQHNERDGFYGVISSKKQGVPHSPFYKHPVSTDGGVMEKFSLWVKIWDKLYK